jgi:glyoxylase-like metal-dependent hydrolase (beta-lactamase superfamily II)
LCDGVASNHFPATWIFGEDCQNEADIQVQAYGPDTYILRQSLCTNFEGPFLYLLFGEDQVLLEDTGAGGIAIDDIVYGIIDDVLSARGQASIELVVVNSHGHGDHTAGNGLFSGQPNTTVVGTTVQAVSDFFGISNWPTDSMAYDLGGRVVDVIPLPGHQDAHIALYDRNTGLLLTGDTLYPGRLYFPSGNLGTLRSSIQRLDDFVAGKDVCWVLGTHIEMTQTAGQDFAFGSDYHPNEHVLQLSRGHLTEMREALEEMSTAQNEVHDDFILYPL